MSVSSTLHPTGLVRGTGVVSLHEVLFLWHSRGPLDAERGVGLTAHEGVYVDIEKTGCWVDGDY